MSGVCVNADDPDHECEICRGRPEFIAYASTKNRACERYEELVVDARSPEEAEALYAAYRVAHVAAYDEYLSAIAEP
jgi:hypothetical protein